MKRIASDDNRLSKPLIDSVEARRELMKLVIIDDEESPQEKVCVKTVITVLGIKDEPPAKPYIDFLLQPGATAGQILDQLKLKDYVLFTLPNPLYYLHLGSPAVANTVAMLRAVINFRHDDMIDPQLILGHGLIAVPSLKAQAYIQHILNVKHPLLVSTTR
jgi:hypothetical protein